MAANNNEIAIPNFQIQVTSEEEDEDDIFFINVICLAFLLLKNKKRRMWIRPILKRRLQQGEFHNLVQEMRLEDEETHFKYFRMNKERYDELLRIVGPQITKEDTRWRKAVSASQRLAITLRYLATGDSMQTISFSYRVGHSTVCDIIGNTCEALWETLMPRYLNPPTSTEQWKMIAENFWNLWNFPHCIGALDGKHVVIQAPANTGSTFFNYKGTFSIVLLAICDANYCFSLIDVGDNGRNSDGGVFSNSSFGQAINNNTLGLPEPDYLPNKALEIPYMFVADEAFPLKTNMMRPYPGRNLPEERRIFNYRLSRSRRIIENTFGILAARWRIFRKPIVAKPEKVELMVKASCCLHNYLKMADNALLPAQRVYCPGNFIDHENNYGYVTCGEWRNEGQGNGLRAIGRIGANANTREAANVRQKLTEYFTSPEGELPWQYEYVRSVGPIRNNNSD